MSKNNDYRMLKLDSYLRIINRHVNFPNPETGSIMQHYEMGVFWMEQLAKPNFPFSGIEPFLKPLRYKIPFTK